MSQMTNYLENKLLDHTLGKAAYTMPTTVYLALFTADPTETGSIAGEVPTGVGYSRQAITTTMSVAASGSSANSGAITFGPATGSWGTVSHVGIMDASTAGNMLLYGALSVSKTIASGDSLQIAASQLSITFN